MYVDDINPNMPILKKKWEEICFRQEKEIENLYLYYLFYRYYKEIHYFIF